MKKNFLKIIIILIAFFTNYILLVKQVFSQQISLSVSPPLLEVFIKPGKSVVVAYNLQNLGDPVILSTKVLPFEPKDNLGTVKIKDEFEGPIRFSLDNADLNFDQPFFLKTRDRQQLLLRIRIPQGTPEGDYYYTLLAQSEPPPTVEGKTAGRAKATIGSHILITVTDSGKVEVKGKIALFDVLPRFKINVGKSSLKFFDSNDKIPIVLIAQNQGKNLIKPEGEIILRGNFGETAKYQIIPQNILSQSQRLLLATPSAQIDCQQLTNKPNYCQKASSLILSGFFIGKYNLSTSIFFGENAPKIFANTSFIAIPFKLILGFLIAIILGLIIIKKR